MPFLWIYDPVVTYWRTPCTTIAIMSRENVVNVSVPWPYGLHFETLSLLSLLNYCAGFLLFTVITPDTLFAGWSIVSERNVCHYCLFPSSHDVRKRHGLLSMWVCLSSDMPQHWRQQWRWPLLQHSMYRRMLLSWRNTPTRWNYYIYYHDTV